ncbi:hypothetical protein U8335_15635 [Roseiconus lacunae]|uniref:hypothetical protein n=1 Tax=Roseiconus lacunae TaxID=2605694 RepID=UPI0030922310|nr:hypothetical protein U8335_15635 [Stieleria sp. HD01]
MLLIQNPTDLDFVPSPSMHSWRAMIAATLVCLSCGVSAEDASQTSIADDGSTTANAPELWLGHYNPERLGNPTERWPAASKAIDGIEFYINMIAYKVPRENLTAFCQSLRIHKIQVGVSGGYFDWESIPEVFTGQSTQTPIQEKVRLNVTSGVGELTARVEMKKLQNLIDAAGGIDLIALDGPIRRLLYPGADNGRTTPKGEAVGLKDTSQAVEEIIRYMQVWQESHPQIRFVVLTNFPNWGWRGDIAYWASGPEGAYWGDYKPAVELLIQRCQQAGVRLEGLRVDHPYEFTTGEFELAGTKWPTPIRDPKTVDWMARIRELEQITRKAGLRFELIVNSEYGGATSNEAFAKRSLEYLHRYHEHGGRPDRYVLEGWYQYPNRVAPDTEMHTLSHTALEFDRQINALSLPAAQ